MTDQLPSETSSKIANAQDESQPMSRAGEIVLRASLHVVAPLVRWLIRHGVTFPEFSSSLKRVFLEQARAELTLVAKDKAAKPITDSALSLMSGVHRRDIREFRLADQAAIKAVPVASYANTDSYGVAAPVFARWLSDPLYLESNQTPRALPRAGDLSFDALVASVTSDVRPRAVLDQLLRFDLVEFDGNLLRVKSKGFVPRDGLEPMSASLASNLQDHIAAAVGNLESDANMLEQAVFVDQISAQSVHQMHLLAAQTWQINHRQLMQLAQERFDLDNPSNAAPATASTPRFRARVGIYFYSQETPPVSAKDPT
jgi:hypothetical protein